MKWLYLYTAVDQILNFCYLIKISLNLKNIFISCFSHLQVSLFCFIFPSDVSFYIFLFITFDETTDYTGEDRWVYMQYFINSIIMNYNYILEYKIIFHSQNCTIQERVHTVHPQKLCSVGIGYWGNNFWLVFTIKVLLLAIFLGVTVSSSSHTFSC